MFMMIQINNMAILIVVNNPVELE